MKSPRTLEEAPDLEALLDFWLPILGMTDWNVRVSYDRAIGKYGSTTVWWKDREANIRILDPAMVTVDWPPFDPELILLHELCHCVVEPIVSDDANKQLLELVVEQMAKSYMRLHRAHPVDGDWITTARRR